MTKSLARTASSAGLINRLLEQPELVSVVQSLEAPVLKRLIDHVGLADAGELVALASVEQIARIFDDDLWRSDRPGKDETFDADRFGLWLEVLLEAGEEVAARRLMALDEDLVTLALQKHILVVDIDALAAQMAERQDMSGPAADEADQIEKALESTLYQELDELRIIARDHDHWDAILSVLLAIDRENHGHLRRLLERCCFLSAEYIDDNGGLYEVLTSEQSLESDVAGEREQRREGQGYVAPSAAASFLALARTSTLEQLLDATERDPITRSYFRHYAPEPRAGGASDARNRPAAAAVTADDTAVRVARFMSVLRAAEVLPNVLPNVVPNVVPNEPSIERSTEPPALPPLEGATTETGSGRPPSPLKTAMTAMREQNPSLYEQRVRELNYLTNVLVSGCGFRGRAFRLFEAAEAVMATCDLGIETLIARRPSGSSGRSSGDRGGSPPAPSSLVERDAVTLFTIGWHTLHHVVSLPAARAVLGVVQDRLRRRPPAAGDDTPRLLRLSRSLARHLTAGKPWLARGDLDAMEAVYGEPTTAALKRLLDECPCLPPGWRLGTTDVGGPREATEAPCFIASSADVAEVEALLTGLSARC